MIISHSRKFIFVKTGKTAGTSIESFISKFCTSEDIVTPVYPELDGFTPRNYSGIRFPFLKEISIHLKRRNPKKIIDSFFQYLKANTFYNHIPAELIRNRIGKDQYNSYFKFTIVRNPWDKTLSHYAMKKKRLGSNFSFQEYVKSNSFHYNYPLYTDCNNNIIIDHFIKYEDLNNGLKEVFEKLNIPFDGLTERAKGSYRKSEHYRDFFVGENAKYIDLIAENYKQEIELFDYKF